MSDFGDLESPILAKAVRFRPGQRAKYVPNNRSFGAFIRSDQMRDPTIEVAQDIARAAATKVVRPGDTESTTGLHARVRKGFKVRRNAGLMKVGGNLRVKVEVFNNAEGSALIEYGGRGLARQRSLGRAGAEFGDFKPEGGPGA